MLLVKTWSPGLNRSTPGPTFSIMPENETKTYLSLVGNEERAADGLTPNYGGILQWDWNNSVFDLPFAWLNGNSFRLCDVLLEIFTRKYSRTEFSTHTRIRISFSPGSGVSAVPTRASRSCLSIHTALFIIISINRFIKCNSMEMMCK